jgi:hypothetical protein
MLEVSEGVFRTGQGEGLFAERLASPSEPSQEARFGTRHCLWGGLGAFPQGNASFDEPALLRRPELLNQCVDARLALIAFLRARLCRTEHRVTSPCYRASAS